MTLDEQIEWLAQKTDDYYELAKAYLSNHDATEYARYNDRADKCQSIVDSLEELKHVIFLQEG